ncbi:hypothetical protein D915_003083 [Fasciola hepatica]|uniref:PDZ domain-containing protein n=1 Tax=Fasciola hepatica TaxID=6192 RepID=A0A4E0S2C7_FASHE|nr:hypothetical protein D915_003083 [Fasciola hepatica]
MSDKTLLLVKKLEKDFREKHRLRMIRASSHCLSVISSSLFTKCEEIECVLHTSKPIDELEKLLSKYAMPRPSCGLPPYNPKLTLIKLKQIYPQVSSKTVYTVQLPENHPSYHHRRAGLILRQHLIRGQIKALFVAGTEQNSPAHRALNLRCGDQLLAISGFPLNWRTLELLRFGLLDAEEIKGLQYNANLNDLARYLLDEPYRRDRTCSDPTKGRAKPLLTLVGTKASVGLNPSRGSDESINKSWKTSQSKEQGNTHEILYHETVLNVANQDSGLGLQLGFDEAADGVFIVSILPHSEAALDGTLSEGDKIVEINYENIESMDPREALKRIKTICQKTSSLHVKVARPLHDLDDDPEQSTNDTGTEVNGIGQKNPVSPNNAVDGDITKEAASDSEEPGTKNSTVKNQVDLEAKYSYHLDYWRAQFSADVEVLIAEYDISNSTCGLGISLEGTMEQDEEESEPLPHHYIIDLTPQGPIESQGILRPGDELLEINENVLFGEDHLRVARILHNIHPKGFMICARYGKPKEIMSDDDQQRQTDDMSEKSRNLEPRFDLDDIQFARPAISEEALTNSSEGSSDVDRNPTPFRVIFARSIRRSSNLKEKQNENMVGARSPTDQNASSENDGTCRTPISNCDADACHLYDTTEGCQYSRLPMPARLASLTDEIPDQRDRIRHHSVVNSQSRAEQKQSLSHSIRTTLHPDKKCLSLMLTKRTGEFLGLEIDAEDGGSLGITLLGIIPDSPLDRLRVAGRKSKPWGTRNSLRRFSAPFDRKSDLPMLKPGDWIASVAGYTFRNRSNFKARRLLRRLVVSSGVFEIEYIPYEWLTDTPADNSSVSWNAEIDAIGRGYNTESDLSES